MANGPREVSIELPETKVAAAESGLVLRGGGGGGGGPLVMVSQSRRKGDVMHGVIRFLCLLTSLVGLSLMVTSEQASTISLYGFTVPLHSKWSFSQSFEYVVGVSAAVAVHSLLQLLICVSRLLQKAPVTPSRNHAWLVFAGDQIFAYATLSAGSAASGVSNLNRTGIRHSSLPNFCKPLHRFCDRVAVSIAFTFISCSLLAISVVLDVFWLSKY